ncbi:F0F1 ATP synthase subunit A [Parvularcula sp. BGMRC 0090]|uniref:ATP synthase subunit a n=2 Tax=Parvularcula maris TaxID=2965077 RepID=A0A9X2L821_9PROT|nr:F0F1 ATP synthase subunit A [Parvularcula maris]MCQ8184819.1 F0F1 ATP synthase subunit A [Parvularcula maris]
MSLGLNLNPLMDRFIEPLAAGPMEQFEIVPIFGLDFAEAIDLSFTNASLWMLITVGTALLFFTFATRQSKLIPGSVQSMGEVTYEFVANMVRDTMGEEGRGFFPFVFTLFIFVFLCNFLGLLPSIPGSPTSVHTFTPTSHIIVTFTLAILSVGLVVVYGVFKHGFGFLKLFAPSGVPLWLLPLITPIEIVSFLSRPVSLAVRLFANMLAGHVVLKVFAGFVGTLLTAGGVLSILSVIPLLGIIGVFLLEFLVAFLQAFVFAILTCIYLQDALHPSH